MRAAEVTEGDRQHDEWKASGQDEENRSDVQRRRCGSRSRPGYEMQQRAPAAWRALERGRCSRTTLGRDTRGDFVVQREAVGRYLLAGSSRRKRTHRK